VTEKSDNFPHSHSLYCTLTTLVTLLGVDYRNVKVDVWYIYTIQYRVPFIPNFASENQTESKMQNKDLTPRLAEVAASGINDSDTKALLSEISEKLGILIDLQRARNPPVEEPQPKTEDDGTIDTSWIIPHKLYDNSQFCRIFNVAKITAQKWRSRKLISYILIGRSVRYEGRDIIRFILVYAARRNFKINPVTDD